MTGRGPDGPDNKGRGRTLRVDPIYERARQVSCASLRDVPVERRRERQPRRCTVLGAIKSAVCSGNTVGRRYRKAATAAGAVIGGAVGKQCRARGDDQYYSGGIATAA